MADAPADGGVPGPRSAAEKLGQARVVVQRLHSTVPVHFLSPALSVFIVVAVTVLM